MTISPKSFKRKITQALANLNIISHVTVEWDDEMNLIQVCNDRVFAPDFDFVYSDTYNVYHLYILTKGRNTEEKCRAGYTIAVVDSGLAASEIVTMIQMLYRRRAGRWSTGSRNKEQAD